LRNIRARFYSCEIAPDRSRAGKYHKIPPEISASNDFFAYIFSLSRTSNVPSSLRDANSPASVACGAGEFVPRISSGYQVA
jgi:hypothetical protein